jgi:phage terminase small subunit
VLTPKQHRFVDEYLIDLNATQAAIRAGYSERTAYSIGDENLKKPEIASVIQAAMDERSQRTEITADYVLTSIVATMEKCKELATFSPAAVLKGAELLGKHLKLFTEKHELSGPNGSPITVIELVAPSRPATIDVVLGEPE